MHLNNLPDDTIRYIMDYLFKNDNYTPDNCMNIGRILMSISLSFNITCEKRSNVKEQYRLLTKYYKYNSDYKFGKPHPILIDILYSECYLPFAYSSFNSFDEEQKKDLKKCIKLFPKCIHSTSGQLRCRTHVTPLYIACINNNVPISIVKYLLSKGAYKNLNIRVNGQKHHILHDMDEMSDGRYARIKDLVNNFEKRDKKIELKDV